MAELSPEVKRLLAAAEALYEALKRAKPTRALAQAIADNVPFSKLQDAEIVVCCSFLKEVEKLMNDAAKAATNGAAPAAGTTVTPDSVEPPKRKPEDKKKSDSPA